MNITYLICFLFATSEAEIQPDNHRGNHSCRHDGVVPWPKHYVNHFLQQQNIFRKRVGT